jgi:hypothetical protein
MRHYATGAVLSHPLFFQFCVFLEPFFSFKNEITRLPPVTIYPIFHGLLTRVDQT